MEQAAFEGVVGQLLQPRLVGLGALDRAGGIGVEQLAHLGERRARQDPLARRRHLTPQFVEVGPRPVVHLARVEVGAQHRPTVHRVSLEATRVDLGGGRCVDVAEIASEVGVRGDRRLGAGCHLGAQRLGQVGGLGRFTGERVEPAVVGPGAALGGDGERLSARGHLARAAPVLEGGPDPVECCRHAAEPRCDVAPGLLALARHQVERRPDRAHRRGQHPQRVQPLAGVVLGERHVEPFVDDVASEPVVVVRRLQLVQRRTGAAHVLGAHGVSLGREVGEQVVEPGDPTRRGGARVECGALRHMVVGELEHG
ncbi:MAG: hypothetical protein R2713_20175 [Ilumatobacteraceae bacterium]